MNAFDDLLSARAVRSRSMAITCAVREDRGLYFRIDDDALEPCAQFVAQVCQENYPNLQIPFHSRWRHFEIEGQKLWNHYLDAHALHGLDAKETSRCAIDLVFVSVLLDAGAGADWSYVDPITGCQLSRSEGLAAASMHLFFECLVKPGSTNEFGLNADGLIDLTTEDLAAAFQVTNDNPLVGIQGRVELLNRLGTALENSSVLNRPGDLIELLSLDNESCEVKAPDILRAILVHFNAIWPNGVWVDGHCYGDAGFHSLLFSDAETDRLVPFHKLSQWLSYSLVEPLQWAGLKITDMNGLTGLPEYRNGGLFLDTGVVRPKDPTLLESCLSVQSEPVVEWRALTVTLLDEIAERVRTILNRTPEELSLCNVLEGGTWAAGRKIAHQNRGNSSPPIQLAIDGTVF